MTPNKQSTHAHVASLIKKELQTRYPLIQWHVKSSIFSGGDSVDVSYTDGPTSHDVQSICDKYVNSSFDAMTGRIWVGFIILFFYGAAMVYIGWFIGRGGRKP